MIDYISLGQQTIPTVPALRCVPLAAPNAPALYRRRVAAARACKATHLVFVDGNEDGIPDTFVPTCEAIVARMLEQGAPIGYAAETIHGKPGMSAPFTFDGFLRDHAIVHHVVVCDVEALRRIDWPKGCYAWEVIAYGTLAQEGWVYDPTVCYDWRPSSSGARLFGGYPRGVINARRWLRGLSVPVLQGDV